MHRWRAVLLIEDAYKKRIQDTLIVNLEARVKILEMDKITTYESFNNELSDERQKFKKQFELTGLEASLKEAYKTDARKYRRQRNFLMGGGGVAAIYGIIRVFVPP